MNFSRAFSDGSRSADSIRCACKARIQMADFSGIGTITVALLFATCGLWQPVAASDQPVASAVAEPIAAEPVAAEPVARSLRLHVVPESATLNGNFDRTQIVVRQVPADLPAGSQPADDATDLTTTATFATSDASVVTVSPAGQLIAVGNGSATVTIAAAGMSHAVPVVVAGVVGTPSISFTEDVIPIIAKAGCNMGACHASQHGKGGLTLSVFGFDPAADHNMLVRDRMQRRVNFNAPEESLLLRKPTAAMPHGGGKRLDRRSTDYQMLVSWISTGAKGPDAAAAKVTSLQVIPNRRLSTQIGYKQQLRVIASYSNGRQRDVTAWSRFDSMDDAVVSVSSTGVVTGVGRGQAPVLVRFEGQADLCMSMIPYAPEVDLNTWKSQNFVDELAYAKFKELGIRPAELCDDATFLRRAYLDAVGVLPTVAETTSFLDDSSPDKRERLVNRLLGLTGDPAQDIYNDRYAAYWTLKWADLIRNNSQTLGDQGMWALHNWLRELFRTNRSAEQFVKELITAQGSTFSSGPSNYYRLNSNPQELAEATSQLFLGIRLACAKCHHHPYEKYGQEDYYSFAAYFGRLGTKGSQDFGLFGNETVVVVRNGGEVHHPRTGAVMPPKPLDGSTADDPLDRRVPLANWLTAAENRQFARNFVNRYMFYLLGRGLVDPVDDLRGTNPPSNPALMEALVDDFIKSGYNIKHLMRTMMTSRLYQLASQPDESNKAETRFFSTFRVKRIPAEALLDAIDDAAGTRSKFPNLPPGTRATDLPDSNYTDYFLTTFGKPKRVSVCECERVPDENLSQALHTLNGDIVANKISDGNGRVAKLIAANATPQAVITELYLATLCRRPTAEEIAAGEQFLAESPNPTECYQDLLWVLINSKQFLFVH